MGCGRRRWIRDSVMPCIVLQWLLVGDLMAADRSVPDGIKSTPNATTRQDLWPWKTEPICGANSVYLFLRLHEVDVAPESIVEDVPSTGKGASMSDLKAECAKFGVATDTVKLRPRDLYRIRAPIIAKMDSMKGDDHFIVVLGAHDSRSSLFSVDGTTLGPLVLSKALVSRHFSGDALISHTSMLFLRLEQILMLVCIVELSLLVWIVVRIVGVKRLAFRTS